MTGQPESSRGMYRPLPPPPPPPPPKCEAAPRSESAVTDCCLDRYAGHDNSQHESRGLNRDSLVRSLHCTTVDTTEFSLFPARPACSARKAVTTAEFLPESTANPAAETRWPRKPSSARPRAHLEALTQSFSRPAGPKDIKHNRLRLV